MFDIDRWTEIYATLSKNRVRTLLTAFGVFWGIFMLIIMLGSGNGLKNGVTSSFGNRALNSVYVWSMRTTIPYMGLPKGRRIQLTNEDVAYIENNVPEIEYLAPRNQLGGFRGSNNVVREGKTGAFSIFGDYPEVIHINPMNIDKGRFINDLDMRDKRKICVIGTKVYDIMFEKGEDPIGQHVQINGVYFTVVGVYSTNSTGEQAEEETQTIYIPFTTFQKAFNYGNRVSWFSMTTKANITGTALQAKVHDVLKRRHKVHPKDPRAFGGFNMEERFTQMTGMFDGIEMLTWFVGILTLLAGVIGVSNIMLIVVRERTKEIGVRRAIGARPIAIITQIIQEAVVLTGLAGYFGVLAGVFLLEGVNLIIGEGSGMFKHPGIDIDVVVYSLLVLVVCGTFAGFLPARRALRIKPVEALRTE
ncbi:MAG: putative ABC transport system permease protein [Flavobacteriales bacterium]|jgi:putative ABC transport system permease protein